MNLYKCVQIDPPWQESGGGRIKRGADRHYPLMPTHQIIRTILSCPLWRPDPNGCHVWLWVTDRYLPDGLDVMRALGARYIRTMAWVKARDGRLQMGLGQYLRGAHELCLLGSIGRLPALTRSQRSVVMAPRGEHSAKPGAAYAVIESISPGPRAEIFARSNRIGWDAWGDQIDCV